MRCAKQLRSALTPPCVRGCGAEVGGFRTLHQCCNAMSQIHKALLQITDYLPQIPDGLLKISLKLCPISQDTTSSKNPERLAQIPGPCSPESPAIEQRYLACYAALSLDTVALNDLVNKTRVVRCEPVLKVSSVCLRVRNGHLRVSVVDGSCIEPTKAQLEIYRVDNPRNLKQPSAKVPRVFITKNKISTRKSLGVIQSNLLK